MFFRHGLVMLLSLVHLQICAAGADFQKESHPRLLLSAKDIASFREKTEKEPFLSMIEILREDAAAASKREFAPGIKYLYHDGPRYDAALYLVEGDSFYAERALEISLKIINEPPFQSTRSKGLSRAAATLTVALAYDICAPVWPEKERMYVSRQLLNAAKGLMRSMGAGWNTSLANNWQAVRYGAAGLAALACDEEGAEKIAGEAYRGIVAHLKANLGSDGWNPEGLGYMMYPWQFTGPFGIAAERLGIGDLRKDIPQVSLAHWTHYAGTVAIPTSNGNIGIHPDLSDDNAHWNAQGTAGIGFWYADSAMLGAFRWMYDHLTGAEGSQLYDSDRGGILYGLLYYPDQVAPVSPAESIGLVYLDKSHGLSIFRNRFKDENDIVAVLNARMRHPRGCHGGADINTFRLSGLGATFATGSGRTGNPGGQTTLFPGDTPSSSRSLRRMHAVEYAKNGSGAVLIEGSCTGVDSHRRLFAVDYSGTAGAPAVFVNIETARNARYWRLNTPGCNTISTDENSFTVDAPNGSSMRVLFPAIKQVVFKTGDFLRGQGSSRDPGFHYRGSNYRRNKWIDIECADMVVAVITLQTEGKPHPEVKLESSPQALFVAVHDRGNVLDYPVQRLFVGNQIYSLQQGAIWFDNGPSDIVRLENPLPAETDPVGILRTALAYHRPDVAAALADKVPRNELVRKNGWSLLHDAARLGDVESVDALLKKGMDINLAADNRWTALLLAAREDHTACAKLLIAADANVNAALDDGNTVLHLAAANGNSALLQALLNAGAAPEAKNIRGRSALEMALLRSRPDAAKLLSAVTPVDKDSEEDGRLLPVAAERGDLNSVKNMLERGVNPDAMNNGWTALHFAAQSGRMEIMKILLEKGADIEARAAGRVTPLYLAAVRGQVNAAALLLSNGAVVDVENRSGLTPLYAAAQRGDVPMVSCLLKAGANINHSGRNGWTPLHIAVQSGYSEIVEIMLENGADVHAVDLHGGWSVMHLAAQEGHSAMIEQLVSAGAMVNVAGARGETPLHVAVSNRRHATVAILLALDADVAFQDAQKRTALDFAESTGDSELLALFAKEMTDE